MAVKQYKKRNLKSEKKKLKKIGSISTGRESMHYLGRSIERSVGGAAVPYSRKKLRRLIAAGELKEVKSGKNKVQLSFRDGRRIIVSKDLKIVITYMD